MDVPNHRFNIPEHLKVKTIFGLSINSPPVEKKYRGQVYD